MVALCCLEQKNNALVLSLQLHSLFICTTSSVLLERAGPKFNMASELDTQFRQHSLSPESARRSQSVPGSRIRPRSPGARLSNQSDCRSPSGPEIYVHQNNDNPAKQDELHDIPVPLGTGLRSEQTPNIKPSTQLKHENSDSNSEDHANFKPSVGPLDSRTAAPWRIETDTRDERPYPESVWSESNTNVPRRNLNAFDVAALILNKMVSGFAIYYSHPLW